MMKCDQNHGNCCTGKTFCVLVIISLKKKECKKVRSFSGRLIPIPCESLKKNNLMSENYMRVFFSWCHEPDRSCLGYTGALWVDLPFFPEATTILTASIVMWSRVNCWGVVIYIYIKEFWYINSEFTSRERIVYKIVIY